MCSAAPKVPLTLSCPRLSAPQQRTASCAAFWLAFASILSLTRCRELQQRLLDDTRSSRGAGSAFVCAGSDSSRVPESLSRRRDETSRYRLLGGSGRRRDKRVAITAYGGSLLGGGLKGDMRLGKFGPLQVATIGDRNRERSSVGSPAAGVAGDTPDPEDLAAAPVQLIDGMETYFEILAANADKIVVVKVFAGFCRACKAFDRKYRALALEYEAIGAEIKFYEMDWMQTRDLCKSLQVKKLPHLEIYAGERGRLESFVCGPSKSSLLKDKLEALLADPLDPTLGTAPPALKSAPLSSP